MHQPGDELYGMPEEWDTIYILPPTVPQSNPANAHVMQDRADLTINNVPLQRYYGPSRLNTAYTQLLATPQQLRKGIRDFTPQDSPIGAQYGTWVGPKMVNQPTANASNMVPQTNQIDPEDINAYIQAGNY